MKQHEEKKSYATTNEKINKNHKQILFLLYKFRYLNTKQFQKLFNHKDPHRVKEWLKYLRLNGYINWLYDPKSFEENTKPAVYYLASKAIRVLKENKDCNTTVLNRFYRKKKYTKDFIEYCVKIADIYLFFQTQKLTSEELNFFTESQITNYDWFPENKPSAYIAVKSDNGTKRYFLELFYDYATPNVYRSVVIKYLKYADSGNWEANAGSEPIPSILFVCTTKRRKSHTYFYAKSLFEKAFEEKINLFLTTKDRFNPENKNIWEKVSL